LPEKRDKEGEVEGDRKGRNETERGKDSEEQRVGKEIEG